MLPDGRVDVEQLKVARQTTRSDSQHVTAARQMVHVRDPAREFRRLMIREQMGSRGKLDSFGLSQRLRDQQVGSRVGFPGRGEMFANPGLVIAQPVCRAQHFEVPFVTFAQIAFGGMARHHEQSKFHWLVSPWPPMAASVSKLPLVYRKAAKI